MLIRSDGTWLRTRGLLGRGHPQHPQGEGNLLGNVEGLGLRAQRSWSARPLPRHHAGGPGVALATEARGKEAPGSLPVPVTLGMPQAEAASGPGRGAQGAGGSSTSSLWVLTRPGATSCIRAVHTRNPLPECFQALREGLHVCQILSPFSPACGWRSHCCCIIETGTQRGWVMCPGPQAGRGRAGTGNRVLLMT